MAIEFARTHIIGRAKGHTAIKAAAYRSGARLHDDRIDRTVDYSHRAGEVAHSEILLPDGAPESLRDRTTLWTAIELAEDASTRRDTAQLAKDHIIALPIELSLEQQIALARDFAKSQFVDQGVGVDLNVHLHSAGNPHAHLMTTTRVIDGVGIGKKARHLNGKFYKGQRLPEDEQLRHRWADFQNAWAKERGIELAITNNNGEWRAELHRGPTRHMDESAQTSESSITETGERVVELRDERVRAILDRPELLINRVTSKKAYFTHHDLWRELARHVDDPTDFQAIKARVERSDLLIPLNVEVAFPDLNTKHREQGAPQPVFTSRKVLDDEMQLRGYASRMNTASEHHGKIADRARADVEKQFSHLSDEQRSAIEHIIDHRRIAVVVGLAGTGKSTLLDAARLAWQQSGYQVNGLAPSGKAAEGLSESAHIGSSTLHSFLYRLKKGQVEIRRNDVFVIDEAGMVNTALMLRAIKAIDQADAKVVLVGDPEQLQPIQAGNPLRSIATKVGYSEIATVRRQREPWQQQATTQLARGDVAAAFNAYAGRGHLVTRDQREDAIDELAQRLASNIAVGGHSHLALAHARKDVAAINHAVRDHLKAKGILGEDHVFDAKAAQRGRADNLDALPDLDPSQQPDQRLHFAAGDRIVFNKNDARLGVKNGTMGTVTQSGFNTLQVQTDEGRAISFAVKDYAEVSHGFAVTVHKAQGITVDHTHVLLTRTWNKHLAYVAMSRHRDTLTLYTNKHSFHEGDEADVLGFADRQESVLDFAADHGLELTEDGHRFEWVNSDELRAKAEAARELLQREAAAIQAALLAPIEAERQQLAEAVDRCQRALDSHSRSKRPTGLLAARAANEWDADQARLQATLADSRAALKCFDTERQRDKLDMKAEQEALRQVEQRHPKAVKDRAAYRTQQLVDQQRVREGPSGNVRGRGNAR